DFAQKPLSLRRPPVEPHSQEDSMKRLVIALALFALGGCSLVRVQGLPFGGSPSSSSSPSGSPSSSGPRQESRGPARMVDCSKVKADENAAQPTDSEQEKLSKGLSLFPTNILN